MGHLARTNFFVTPAVVRFIFIVPRDYGIALFLK